MRGHVQPRFGTRAGEWVAIIEPDDWIDPAMFEDTASFADFFGERVEVVKTPWVEVLNRDNPDHERQAACRLHDKMSTSAKPFTLEERPLPIEIHLVIWSALDRRFFLEDEGIRFIPYLVAGWADNPFLIDALMHARSIVRLNKAYCYYRCELPNFVSMRACYLLTEAVAHAKD